MRDNTHIFYSDRIAFLAILILLFSLPFFRNLSTITIILLTVVTILKFSNNKIRKKHLNIANLNWPSLIIFGYYFFSIVITGLTENIFLVEKRLTLLAIPLLFFLNSRIITKHCEKFFISFIAGCTTALLLCILTAFINSIFLLNDELFFEPRLQVSQQYNFMKSSVMGGNHFFGSNFSIFMHPSYFALYLLMAQVFIFYLAKLEKYHKYRLHLFFIFIFFLVSIFFLSSKVALLSAFLLIMYITYQSINSLRLKLTSLIILIFSGFFFFKTNPRVDVFFDNLRNIENTLNEDVRFGFGLRLLTWDASLDIIKKNLITGVGEANNSSALLKVYNEKDYVVPAERGYNSHNQFLDFMIGGGLIGLTVYLFSLIFFFIKSIYYKDILLFFFIFIFGFHSLFENYLSNYDGIVFFAVFSSLLLIKIK